MHYKIVVDSCCDLTPEFCEKHGIASIPLSLTLGDTGIQDDEQLDLPSFMEQMKNFKGKIGSAAPPPQLYKDAYQPDQTTFAVTLSHNLSCSYANAMIGKEMAEAEGMDVHVFDSKSASAGEVLVALKLIDYISQGIQKTTIISLLENFINQMKTYFVLDNIDNLLKNGRIGKITGKLITVLNIKPIMGSDGDGNIKLFSHARGQKEIIEKLADTIGESGKPTDGERLVIAHCNNPGLAEKLTGVIRSRYRFSDIVIVPTKGVSSVYANDKGIIIAF